MREHDIPLIWVMISTIILKMSNFLSKLFGSANSRVVTQYYKIVRKINDLEPEIMKLSDNDLAHKTIEFKDALADGKTLDDILPEVFATVREVSRRVLGMRHFDVQLIGGITLHKGQIAEMKTGEGKTLAETCPVYLNALSEKGVHVVTVNDYLAKRDAEQMSEIYGFLGLSTGTILSGMFDEQKRQAYNADITYGTNHEFGFDYLRDNLKFSVDEMVMRPFNYAVVDEIDSILIDEARTPLIISGQDDSASQMYVAVNDVVKNIGEGDYELELKHKNVTFTEQGMAKVEKELMERGLIDKPLYDSSNVSMVYYVNCALKANKLFRKDVDYMVRDDQVMIIDEFTGRVMQGRRYSEGLHQALEAKEGVKVQAESQTIASISYQNLFRMYPKLSGMTGTAMTEEAEFEEIYKLKVVSIPPNKPVIRKDMEDSIYLSMAEKDEAVIKLIKECVARKQPVLVGTTNLDRSEYISGLLTREGIRHNVLNAKQHEREAYIISEAGAPGAVTIATNMAGRGTDIKLGGSVETRVMFECADIEDENERNAKIEQIKKEVEKAHDEVVKAGGLFVIGTERNEARRIDNQLRGRSGRQGDPGASKYFLSLEDDLIKRFGSPNIKQRLERVGMKKGEDLTHRWISKIIKKAQERIEAMNFDIRKQLLKYDDVINEQRKEIYAERLKLMKSNDVSGSVEAMVSNTAIELCDMYTSPNTVPYEWQLPELKKEMQSIYGIDLDINAIADDTSITFDLFKQQLVAQAEEKFKNVTSIIPIKLLHAIEKELMLKTLDGAWKKHLVVIEHLRRSINLQAYAQKNPLNEYKVEAFRIFEEMMKGVRQHVTSAIMHLSIPEELLHPNETQNQIMSDIDTDDYEKLDFEDNKSSTVQESNVLFENINTNVTDTPSRNSECPCGSGLRYKYCHGKLEDTAFSLPKIENNEFESNESVLNKTSHAETVDYLDDTDTDIVTGRLQENESITPQEILKNFAEDQRRALLSTDDESSTTNNSDDAELLNNITTTKKTKTKTRTRKIAKKDDMLNAIEMVKEKKTPRKKLTTEKKVKRADVANKNSKRRKTDSSKVKSVKDNSLVQVALLKKSKLSNTIGNNATAVKRSVKRSSQKSKTKNSKKLSIEK